MSFDPEQEAPGFDFNPLELKRWGIVQIWAARDGSEIDRARLRLAWKQDVATFEKWAYRLWATQRSNPTINTRYGSAGSTRPARLDRAQLWRDHPELMERLRDNGTLAVLQSAGCTPAECEVLLMKYAGHSVRDIAKLRGVSYKGVHILITRGEERLRRLVRRSAVSLCHHTEGVA